MPSQSQCFKSNPQYSQMPSGSSSLCSSCGDSSNIFTPVSVPGPQIAARWAAKVCIPRPCISRTLRAPAFRTDTSRISHARSLPYVTCHFPHFIPRRFRCCFRSINRTNPFTRLNSPKAHVRSPCVKMSACCKVIHKDPSPSESSVGLDGCPFGVARLGSKFHHRQRPSDSSRQLAGLRRILLGACM